METECFFIMAVKKVVKRKLAISLKALNTKQFVSCKSTKFKQPLIETLVLFAQRSTPEPAFRRDLWSAVKQPSLSCLGGPGTYVLRPLTATDARVPQSTIPSRVVFAFLCHVGPFDVLLLFHNPSFPSGEPLEQNNQSLKHCSTLSNT